MTTTAARVEVLTAEVRVLMVGSRQVTLSVLAQLDAAAFDEIEPFGRVRPRSFSRFETHVVGRDGGGALVRSWLPERVAWPKDRDGALRPEWSGNYLWISEPWRERRLVFLPRVRGREAEAMAAVLAWRELPLIVLAGLR
jgi:hypothetical protein